MSAAPVIRRFADLDALSHAAADELGAIARAAVRARGRCDIALSGGSTPRHLFGLLAQAGRDALPWDHIELWWGDERAVPPDHADSNYRMLRESLLARIPIPASNVHRMEAEASDLDAAAARYAEELGQAPLDLAILGMGADGHTASLFAGSPALAEQQRRCVAVAAPQTARPAVRRITLTHPVFAAAREVIFLIAGEDKALTLKRVIEGPDCPDALPSQTIARRPTPVIIFCDRGAAAELSTISRPSP